MRMPRKAQAAEASENSQGSRGAGSKKPSWADTVRAFLLDGIKDFSDNILNFFLGFESRFHEFIGRLVRRAFVYVLLVIGLIFVFIGLALAIADAFDVGPGGGYMIVGILIFCLSFVFHIFSARR